MGDDYNLAEITISCLVWGHTLGLGKSQSHHLLAQLNILGTQHPTMLQWQWMDLPSVNFILEKQFILHCGQSVIKQESQRNESAKSIPFSSFLLFLQLLCLILI